MPIADSKSYAGSMQNAKDVRNATSRKVKTVAKQPPKPAKQLTDLAKAIAARVGQARKERFNRPADAARAIGITRGFLCNLEKGWRSLTPETAQKIAGPLGVTPEFLLHGEKNLKNGVSFFLASDIPAFIALAEGHYPESQMKIMIQSIRPLPPRLVCVEMPDHAMERERSPAYPWGSDIFIDPDKRKSFADYESGVDVVQAVITGKDEAVFRLFVRVGAKKSGKAVLKAFNSDYPDILFDEARGDKIVGLVIGLIHLNL